VDQVVEPRIRIRIANAWWVTKTRWYLIPPPLFIPLPLSNFTASPMSTRKVVFPAQGFVQYNLVESSTSRGVKARFSKSKKSLASSNTANNSKDTPPIAENRSLKRRRTESEPTAHGREKSHSSIPATHMVDGDQYPEPGSFEDETAEDFNPEIFLPMDGRTSDGKVSGISTQSVSTIV
jgi:hypothetical protein